MYLKEPFEQPGIQKRVYKGHWNQNTVASTISCIFITLRFKCQESVICSIALRDSSKIPIRRDSNSWRGSGSYPGSWKRARIRCQEKRVVWTNPRGQEPAKWTWEPEMGACCNSGVQGRRQRGTDWFVRGRESPSIVVRWKQREGGRILNREMTWGKESY